MARKDRGLLELHPGNPLSCQPKKESKRDKPPGAAEVGSIRDSSGRKAFKVTFEQIECRRRVARWRLPGSQSSRCEGPDQGQPDSTWEAGVGD